jgi:hypothetical protein
MDAGLADPLFWGSLAVALGIAWLVAFPVNRWLIARGRGHAVVHGAHDPAAAGGQGTGHGPGHDPASDGDLR